MQLTRAADVAVLDLGTTENRFNLQSVAELAAAITEAESAGTSRALVLVGSGKFWSNGLDVEWLTANPAEFGTLIAAVQQLFAQLLEAGVPTVAAIQGHAFGAGAMLALCCDHRVMRQDRGYFCFPEVDLRMPFTLGMTSLLTSHLSPETAHHAMTTGQRYGGIEAVERRLVHEAVDESELMPRAVAWAETQTGKDPQTLRAIKQGLYRQTLAALRA